MTIEQQALELADEVGVDPECIAWDRDSAFSEAIIEEPGWRLSEWGTLTLTHGCFRASSDIIDDVRKTARQLLAAMRAFGSEVAS